MKTIIIRELNDLTFLSDATGVVKPMWLDKIRFDLSDVNRSLQLSWERKLNTYLKRCGCVAGVVVTLMISSLTIYYVIFLAVERSIISQVSILFIGFLVAFVIGFVTKLTTLFITAIQFKSMVRHILKVTQMS